MIDCNMPQLSQAIFMKDFSLIAIGLLIMASRLSAQEEQTAPKEFPQAILIQQDQPSTPLTPLHAPAAASLRTNPAQQTPVTRPSRSPEFGNKPRHESHIPLKPTLIPEEADVINSSQVDFSQFQKPLAAPLTEKRVLPVQAQLEESEDPFNVSAPQIRTGPPANSVFAAENDPAHRLPSSEIPTQPLTRQVPEPASLQIPSAHELPPLTDGGFDELPQFQQDSPQTANETYSPVVEQTTNFPPATRGSVFDSPQQAALNSSSATAKTTTDAVSVHEVLPGENYWTISRQHYGSARYFAALAEYNRGRIPRPDRMQPGMFVLVPDVELLEQRFPEITWANAGRTQPNEPAGFFIDQSGRPAFRIGKGDTLTDIAQLHLGSLTRWTEIQQLNAQALGPRGSLKIGMVLQLPPDASQVSLAPPIGEFR